MSSLICFLSHRRFRIGHIRRKLLLCHVFLVKKNMFCVFEAALVMFLHHQLQVPSLSPSSSSWMWNYDEERRRQQKWQEEQERLLQVNRSTANGTRLMRHPFVFILVLKPWVRLCVYLGEIPAGSGEAGGRMAESTTRRHGGGTPGRRGSSYFLPRKRFWFIM